MLLLLQNQSGAAGWGCCVLLLGARRHGRAHRVRGGWRVGAELEARRAWPAAAGGGARFGARTRDAVLAPRPLPPRAPRRAGAAERAGHTCTFRGSDRTVCRRCVSQFPQPSLSNQLNFYILRRLIARRKKRERGPRNALPNGRTCHPGYAVWCGKCAELRRRSAPLGEPATHMPARHAAP